MNIEVNNVSLWFETRGNSNNPPLLLINGGGPRASMWPDKFCDQLVKEKFFVIRYDHRDSGYSSESKEPYDLQVLAEDACKLMYALNISSAHVVGASMGAWVSILVAANYPEKIKSLTCMISGDLDTFLKTTNNEETDLPKPTKPYRDWLERAKELPHLKLSEDEKIKFYLEVWKIANGPDAPFDEILFETIVKDTFINPDRFTLNNQMKAMQCSAEKKQIDLAMPKVKAPTMIIHGQYDPIFSIEHGEYLKNQIPNAKLEVVQGMGHAINPYFVETLITLLIRNSLNAK